MPPERLVKGSPPGLKQVCQVCKCDKANIGGGFVHVLICDRKCAKCVRGGNVIDDWWLGNFLAPVKRKSVANLGIEDDADDKMTW